MRPAGKLLLLMNQGIKYLLNDLFTTAQAAPLAASTTSQPGPGTMVKAIDTNAVAYIAAKALLFYGTGATNYADPGYIWKDVNGAAFARQLGRVAFFTVITPITDSGLFVCGWSNNATPATGTLFGALLTSAGIQIKFFNNSLVSDAYGHSITYCIAVMARASGYYCWIIGGAFTAWTLLFAETIYTDANIYPAAVIGASLNTTWIPRVNVRDILPLQNEANIIGLNTTNPVSGTIQTATADGEFHLRADLGAGALGKISELRYRVADASNYMLARLQWNNGSGQYDFVTGHVIAGSETLQGTPVANVGDIALITVRANGNSHNFYTTDSSNVHLKRYGTITDATGAANTGVAGVSAAGVALRALQAWPATGYVSLGSFTVKSPAIATFGDSKTLNSIFVQFLMSRICHANSQALPYLAWSIASGGATVASRASTIAADLAGVSNVPDVVLFNLGANDVGTLPAQNTWTTNFNTCVDAINAKFPNALIYVMRVGRQGLDADCDTYDDTYIAQAVAGRSAFCRLGADERIFLKGSDNYASETSDGIHPTVPGGTQLTGEAWATALGY